MNRFHIFALLAALTMDAHAASCQRSDRANAGCADRPNGVSVWPDGTLEIDIKDQAAWPPNAMCTGRWLLQFPGAEPATAARTALALTAYTAGTAVGFVCNAPVGPSGCRCDALWPIPTPTIAPTR